MTRYAKMFSRLREKEEGAFVPFVVVGDPSLDTSLKIIETMIAGGADALELGIPFSDPIADGPVIQRADMRALANGAYLEECLKLLSLVREKNPEIPMGLLIYANLVAHLGADKFYQSVHRAGVDSVLVADVPTLEAEPFVEIAIRHQVDPVLIVPPNISDDRLQKVAKWGRGYTYVVRRPGVTGVDKTVEFEHKPLLKRLKELGAAPSVFGFGISQPEHVKQALQAGADGAISGSAIVAIIEKNLSNEAVLLEKVNQFTQEMKAATKKV